MKSRRKQAAKDLTRPEISGLLSSWTVLVLLPTLEPILSYLPQNDYMGFVEFLNSLGLN